MAIKMNLAKDLFSKKDIEEVDYNDSQNETKSINKTGPTHNIEFCYRITNEMYESIIEDISKKHFFNWERDNAPKAPLHFKKIDKGVSFQLGSVDKEKKPGKIYTKRMLSSEDNESTLTVYGDPENSNVVYLIGKGTGYDYRNENKRWIVFDSLYKVLKKAEMNNTLKENSEDFGIDFGGKLVITNNVGSENDLGPSCKDFQIGHYKPEHVDYSEIERIYDNFNKKFSIVKKMTIKEEDRDALLRGEPDVEIPVIGLMGSDINNLKYDVENDERIEVGKLSYQTLIDPVNHKPHKVLELSISESVTAPPESIADFTKTLDTFTKNNGIDIEGVTPERNLMYDEEGNMTLILLESDDGKHFSCVQSNDIKAEVLLNETAGRIINVTPSPLSYDIGGIFNSSGLSIAGMKLKPKIDEKRSEATMSVYQESYFRRSFIEPCPNVDYANFILEFHNPVNLAMPNVNKFFENKKTTMVTMKSPLTWLCSNLVIDSGIDKADIWHMETPIKEGYETEKMFDHLYQFHQEGMQIPKEMRFEKLEIDGEFKKVTMTREQVESMFNAMDQVVSGIEKHKDKKLEDSIEFPDF